MQNNTKPSKPLNIMELYPFKEWDGPANHVFDLIKGLRQLNQNILMVTGDWDGIKKIESVCPVYKLSCKKAERIKLTNLPFLVKLINQHQIDVIHTHGGYNTWIALAASKLAKRAKVVTTWHALRTKHDMIHRWQYKNLDAIIGVSHMLKQQILDVTPIDPQKVHGVPNGIDVDYFSQAVSTDIRHQLGFGGMGSFVAGYIGRLHPDKGIEYAIKAIALLPENLNCHLMVVGWRSDENYARYLEKLIVDLKLQAKIRLFKQTNDVRPYMAAIDTLLLPTVSREAFGLVLCEAMASLKPVITTNTGGQVEIVQDSVNGFLVNPRSEQELAKKIESLASDKQLCTAMGVSGRKIVEEKFSLKTMAQNTLDVFYNCLNR